jgi:orotate phosphoribosyltransferase
VLDGPSAGHAKTATVGIRPSRTTGSVRPMGARERLIDELRSHAVVVGRVVLTSGQTAEYYVDAKRAILRPAGFAALGELVAERARAWGATAVGGLTMGADAPACAALAGGADVKAFFVRKEVKQHGLARRIEGPPLQPGERCLIVEDVVTTGGSTLQAIDAVRSAGLEVAGVVTIVDRLAGGAERIREAATGVPYEALATIDDLYPERPDRG